MPANMPASRSLVLALAALAAFAALSAVTLTYMRRPTSAVSLVGKSSHPGKMPLTQGLRVIEGSVARGFLKTLSGSDSEEKSDLPSMAQVRHQRKIEEKAREEEEAQYQKLKTAPMHDCGGMSVSGCALELDATQIQHMLGKEKHAREAQLLQVVKGSPQLAASVPTGREEAELEALKRQEALAQAKNKEEQKLHALLLQNAALARQNAALQHPAPAHAAGAPSHTHAAAKKVQQQQAGVHKSVRKGGEAASNKLAATPTIEEYVNEATQGNPPGVKEHVPITVTAKEPGPADFNGAQAVVAHIPHLGFGPSVLDEQGVEQRGSFTVRKANPYGGIWFRVYGKINHPIKCTLRGYRKLQDEFQGNTVFTGYKQEWDAKTSISTGVIPPGPPDNFDIMTCRDKATGEVQHFKSFPDPSPGFFEDPNDPAFKDEYGWP
mmetsp:Transcript_36930/g.75704  ORF Transcript_36930/g.75704 Transcript_36930/m.75704 type:complete len:436 (+) Transcript_36930:75-1382(+)